MGTIFGTWSVMNLYRSDSLQSAASESTKCKLYLVGVQKVR